jgi:hypothetical protein
MSPSISRYPYIASTAGLVSLWAAVVGVLMQFFINMEIERYTLATGQTAITGFQRLWKPWGLILVLMALLATTWPGWATSAATLVTFLIGGDANVIAIAALLAILVGALAASGAGGANNLVQSNWIRDKGFGMGRYAPRIVSPITGEEEAALSGQRYSFPNDEQNMSRWREWWKRANLEQFWSFAVIAVVSIAVFSLIAYSTVFGNPALPDESGCDFISLEADELDQRVGDWFGTLFLAIGAVSLFAAAVGIVDYVSRLVADVVRVGYTEGSERWTESRLYFAVVWTMVIVGCLILLAGFDQPLVLITISTVLGGVIMVVYSGLLVVTNRRYLPGELKRRGYRLGIMLFSIALLGVTSTIVAIDQFGNL